MEWEPFITRLVELMGFSDTSIEIDDEYRKGTIFIHDNPTLIKEKLPALVESINYIARLLAKKHDTKPYFFDVNNYRRERERLIAELARAAARKALASKEEVLLPAMNAYERRIVHVELATHPDITTESHGVGKGRHVVVRVLS